MCCHMEEAWKACYVEEESHRRLHIVRFYLCKVFRIVTKIRSMVVKGWGVMADRHWVSHWSDETVEVDGVDGYTALTMLQKPLNRALSVSEVYAYKLNPNKCL